MPPEDGDGKEELSYAENQEGVEEDIAKKLKEAQRNIAEREGRISAPEERLKKVGEEHLRTVVLVRKECAKHAIEEEKQKERKRWEDQMNAQKRKKETEFFAAH